MNINSRVCTIIEYQNIVKYVRNGFETLGGVVRPNERIATIIVLAANSGISIADLLTLRLNDFEKIDNGYSVLINERRFLIPSDLYDFVCKYVESNSIKGTAKLFDISSRNINKHLTKVCEHLGYEEISMESFKKMFAKRVYEKNKDLKVLQHILNHSSLNTTNRFVAGLYN